MAGSSPAVPTTIFRMHPANFYSRQNFWEAMQLGIVFEIGVRFPAITQHPVLQVVDKAKCFVDVSEVFYC